MSKKRITCYFSVEVSSISCFYANKKLFTSLRHNFYLGSKSYRSFFDYLVSCPYVVSFKVWSCSKPRSLLGGWFYE